MQQDVDVNKGIAIIVIVLALVLFLGVMNNTTNEYLGRYIVKSESGRVKGYEYTYNLSTIGTKSMTYNYGKVVEGSEQEDMKKELIEFFKLEKDDCKFDFPQDSTEDEFLGEVFIDPIVIKCEQRLDDPK